MSVLTDALESLDSSVQQLVAADDELIAMGRTDRAELQPALDRLVQVKATLDAEAQKVHDAMQQTPPLP